VKPAATTTTAVATETVGPEHPVADGLLSFKLKHYQPRGAVAGRALRDRKPRVPQTIKDAIVRWLDEQL
jgi:hypothetical protein